MIEIPRFESAVRDFMDFLSSLGHPAAVVWVFRDDIWRRSRDRAFIRWPVPRGARVLVEHVYDQGRTRGIIGVHAIAKARGMTFATAWFPKFPEEEVQGCSAGLKLSIADPLADARLIPSPFWPAIRWTSSYQRYQALECTIGTRKWAAA